MMNNIITFRKFAFESITQEDINKKLKELEELTDEKKIIKLKSEIELLQDKLSKNRYNKHIRYFYICPILFTPVLE